MDEYKIKLDRSVLKQLGSQLYGDTPSVIAELVANSYDADAKNVWITVDTSQNNIYVEDDGKGMTAQDINDSFLNIGYDKRDGHNVTPLGRKIMGRKGIGKLAAFSLTNTVFVYSTKSNTKCGCKLDFKRITDGEEPQAISADTITFSQDRLSADGTGTRIELHDVKKRVALSYRFIVNKLIRTFDVNDDNFSIHILPSEKAFAYKMKMEALSHQGKTSRQVGEKWSVSQISEAGNDSERQIHRYIRLTNLIPDILKLVDEGRIALTPAVELSYLNSHEQNALYQIMDCDEVTPSLSQAQRLRKLSEDYTLTDSGISQIMSEIKGNQKEYLKIEAAPLKRYFPPGTTAKQMQTTMIRAMEFYRQHTQNRADKPKEREER